MGKTKPSFGSKSIAFRHKPTQQTSAPSKWRPQGPFRFFDLPPELRTRILEFAILEWDSHKEVLHVFLTCRRLYDEAASMFYREVMLDNTQLRGTADPFLIGPLTPLSPRIHVRTLMISFCLEDQIPSFNDLYGSALRAMADEGNLDRVRLHIESRFPSDDFWGAGDGDGLFCEDEVRLLTGKHREKEIWAPAFVAEAPFQSFLKFLGHSGIRKVSLLVASEDHYKFWCTFHRVHPSGVVCDGEWGGRAKLLRVNRKRLIKSLRGAHVA